MKPIEYLRRLIPGTWSYKLHDEQNPGGTDLTHIWTHQESGKEVRFEELAAFKAACPVPPLPPPVIPEFVLNVRRRFGVLP